MKTTLNTDFYYKKEEISSQNFSFLVLFTLSFWLTCFFSLLAVGEVSDSIAEVLILRVVFLFTLVSIPILLLIRIRKYKKRDPLISIYSDHLTFRSEIIELDVKWDNIKTLTYSSLIPRENRSKAQIWIFKLKNKASLYEKLEGYDKVLAKIFEIIHGSPLILKLKEIDFEERDFKALVQSKVEVVL